MHCVCLFLGWLRHMFCISNTFFRDELQPKSPRMTAPRDLFQSVICFFFA